MKHAQTLNGDPMVVLTQAEYQALIDDAGDAALVDQARADDEGRPTLPADLMTAMLDGEIHPLTAWRKALGITGVELAQKAGIRPATISNIENWKLDPRISTVKAIANALNLDVGDIVE